MYSFIQANIPEDTLDEVSSRNSFIINFYRNEQFIYKIQETLGIIDPIVSNQQNLNLSVRHKNILEQKSVEINHITCHFSKDL